MSARDLCLKDVESEFHLPHPRQYRWVIFPNTYTAQGEENLRVYGLKKAV